MPIVWIAVGILICVVFWWVSDALTKKDQAINFWKAEAEKLRDELELSKSPLRQAREMGGKNKC